MIPNEIMLAILQNQIKNAVDENKVDNSKFAAIKVIADAYALTDEEKADISENVYDFLFDSSHNSLFVLDSHISSDDWTYYALSCNHIFVLDNEKIKRINFREDYYVHANINGDILYTDVTADPDDFPSAGVVTLEADKYTDVTFYANYFTNTPIPIYRFSSGIILDSSTETPLYKIVFASYNVNTAKVTFVEKVLS